MPNTVIQQACDELIQAIEGLPCPLRMHHYLAARRICIELAFALCGVCQVATSCRPILLSNF